MPQQLESELEAFARMPPEVIDWFYNSQSTLAKEWRERIKLLRGWRAHLAQLRQIERQKMMQEHAKLIDPKAPMRPLASIDEDIATEYYIKYGSGCFHNEEFIDDCRKTAPELFYPKP